MPESKMTMVKKIILFLFGIVLIVFGNKAAIDTIFKNEKGIKEVDPNENKATVANPPVITEEIGTKEAEVITEDNTVSPPKLSEVKTKEVSKKVTPKPKPIEKTDKTESTAEVVETKEDIKVIEAPKTIIEPVKEETAKASE